MKVGVDKTETEWSSAFPLTLTLSSQGRGNAIHPPSKLGGILAHFYKKKLPTLNFRLSKSIALVNREVVL